MLRNFLSIEKLRNKKARARRSRLGDGDVV